VISSRGDPVLVSQRLAVAPAIFDQSEREVEPRGSLTGAAGLESAVDPRIERSRRVILRAAVEELGAVGYGAFTIESVAARAGVGKSTIYRLWSDRLALITDAFKTFHEQEEPDSYNVRMPDEHPFTLRQVDLACADFAAIADDLDFIKAQLARIPTRGELARTALAIMFGATGSRSGGWRCSGGTACELDHQRTSRTLLREDHVTAEDVAVVSRNRQRDGLPQTALH
jgi:AcrR family transcriptional regulator